MSIHTLTYDNGKEFANRSLMDGCWEARAISPVPTTHGERGLNEDTNGLIRQYFPKRTDFGEMTDAEVREVQDKLNIRPRKCHGWRTPNEIISDHAAIVALPG